MYSPKIREDLVSRLYHAAKARGVPMTRLVNEALEEYLRRADGPGPAEPDRAAAEGTDETVPHLPEP
jgi:hypothetical protein